MLDPFLLLDEMAPKQFAPGEALGAPDHPHRGFETVTYIVHGESRAPRLGGQPRPDRPRRRPVDDRRRRDHPLGDAELAYPDRRRLQPRSAAMGQSARPACAALHRSTKPLPSDSIASLSGDAWTAELVAGSMFGARGPGRDTHTGRICTRHHPTRDNAADSDHRRAHGRRLCLRRQRHRGCRRRATRRPSSRDLRAGRRGHRPVGTGRCNRPRSTASCLPVSRSVSRSSATGRL